MLRTLLRLALSVALPLLQALGRALKLRSGSNAANTHTLEDPDLPVRCGGVVWSAAGVEREVDKTPSSSSIVVQRASGASARGAESGLAGGERSVVFKTLAGCGRARASGGEAEDAPKAAATGGVTTDRRVRLRIVSKTLTDLSGSSDLAEDAAGTE